MIWNVLLLKLASQLPGWMLEAGVPGVHSARRGSRWNVTCAAPAGVDSPRWNVNGTLTQGWPAERQSPVVLGVTCEIAGSVNTASVYTSLPKQSKASTAAMVTTSASGVVGVPVMSPPLESDSPEGSVPDWTTNEYGAVPPDGVSVWA